MVAADQAILLIIVDVDFIDTILFICVKYIDIIYLS